jgi:hypothetical protein
MVVLSIASGNDESQVYIGRGAEPRPALMCRVANPTPPARFGSHDASC